MRLNESKTKTTTMIVSRSRTMYPQLPLATIGGTVLKECVDLSILGVTFDSKITFEKHLRSVSRAASQRLPKEYSGEYSIKDCFLGDDFGVLSSPFWITVLLCCARLQMYTLNYFTIQ